MTRKRDLIFEVKGKIPCKTQAIALSTTGVSQISASIYQRWGPAPGFRQVLVNSDQSLNWTVQAKYLLGSEPRWRMNFTDKTQLSKAVWTFTPETDSLITPFLHPCQLLLEGDTCGAAETLLKALMLQRDPILLLFCLFHVIRQILQMVQKSVFWF